MVAFNNKGGKLHHRRGISTIVGSAIFLILFASATSTFFIAMDAQRDTINSQKIVSDTIMDKTKEKFSIAVSSDENNNNRLGIQVKNQGTNPVEIDDIWIINQSGNFPAKKYLIDYKDSVIPPGYGSNILENTPLYMNNDQYDIKVVSTLGTIAKSKVKVGANDDLRATMLTIPPDVKINKNVTVTMHVENIGMSTLLNVAPAFGLPNISTALDPPNPPVPTPVDLDPGESVFFTWQFKVKGPGLSAGNKISFDNYAVGTREDMPSVQVKSNIVKESIKLLEPDTSDVIILTQDLLSRPEIFMVIPSPTGDGGASERVLWGTNIVNPTGSNMEVSKVIFSLISPRANNADVLLDPKTGTDQCSPVGISPATGWSCPSENQLMWTDLTSPVIIPPFSVKPFLVKVQPGDSSNGEYLEAVIVHTHVFTSVGEFGKAGYGTTFDGRNERTSLANVILTDNKMVSADANIISSMTGISSGNPVVFNATLIDYEASTNNYIKPTQTKLIINIPKGWTLDAGSIKSFPTGHFTTSSQTFSDGSSQIVGILNQPITGAGSGSDKAKTIQFYATAPTVTSEQMYVMYLLADGLVRNDGLGSSQDDALGPLGEVVLQVVP